LLLGAAIAALTYPLFCGPIYNRVDKKFKKLSDRSKRLIAASATMICFGLMAVIPIAGVLWSATGSIDFTGEVFFSILEKNFSNLDGIINKVNHELNSLRELYPSIPIDPKWVKAYLSEALSGMLQLQPSLMAFLLKGTGSIMVQVVLCTIAVFFYYAEGAVLATRILKSTPLSEEEVDRLMDSFKKNILRFLCDSVGNALLKGITLGTLVGLFLGYNPILFILFASFICLLPLVGNTLIWLPAATLLYQKDQLILAVLFVLLCQAGIFGTGYLMKRLGRRLQEQEAFINFFIFLSVVGGLVSFGLKGLIMGPVAVILVIVMGSFWKEYYLENTVKDKVT
jgi:predicted PurR-regulated permease PerM